MGLLGKLDLAGRAGEEVPREADYGLAGRAWPSVEVMMARSLGVDGHVPP
jgi:hypothetical protein